MENQLITHLLSRIGSILKTPESGLAVRRVVERFDPKEPSFESFIEAFSEVAVAANLSFVRQEFTEEEFKKVLRNLSFPTLVFVNDGELKPLLLFGDERSLNAWIYSGKEGEKELSLNQLEALLPSILTYEEIRCQYRGIPQRETQEKERYIFSLPKA